MHMYMCMCMHMHMHMCMCMRMHNIHMHIGMHMQALPVSLKLLGEATLLTYVPVIEQVVFLQRQGRQGGR